MTATRMGGGPVARQIKAELSGRVAALRERGIVPGLGTILVGDDPASHAYVNGKHKDCQEVGITSIRHDLPDTTSAAQLQELIEEMNADPAVTGFLVQMPLPAHLDDHWALNLVDPDKDIDGLTEANLGRLVTGQPGHPPCTPQGVVELLRRYDVPLNGAEVCIIGRGTTVGRPLALLLSRRSENATVTQCHTGTRDLGKHTRQADVVICAAGVPGILRGDMVKPGAVVVDVSISRTEAGLVGDVAPDVWDVASLVSPVPGGVGLMTRAMLLVHVVERAEQLAARA